MPDAILAATHVEIAAEPRYWEDAVIDGVRDDQGTLVPGRVDDEWRARIRLADGRVEDWPTGVTARIHYKVCDAGTYWLTDAAGTRLARWRGSYVPGAFLCHGRHGFGDYVILAIDGDSAIADYERPTIDEAQWERTDTADRRTERPSTTPAATTPPTASSPDRKEHP